MRTVLAIISILAVSSTLVGCSTDENPITPEKMEQIRQQEGDQRANFKPSEGALKDMPR